MAGGRADEDEPQNPNAHLQALIGRRARSRREELKLSLRELASRMGVTASFLSLLERGMVSPSLDSLRKASLALGVPISHFLMAESGTQAIVRKHERRKLSFPDSMLECELIVPNIDRKMEVMIVNLAPGANNTDHWPFHASEECILVLEGSLDIEIGTAMHRLQEGDSIYFAASEVRMIAPAGDQPARYLSAITPPALLNTQSEGML